MICIAIREAGGAFGKMEVAREEEYFYRKVDYIHYSFVVVVVDYSGISMSQLIIYHLFIVVSQFLFTNSNKNNSKS